MKLQEALIQEKDQIEQKIKKSREQLVKDLEEKRHFVLHQQIRKIQHHYELLKRI